MPQHVRQSAGTLLVAALVLGIAGVLILPMGPTADDGQYRTSPHGDATHGVWRDMETPRGSCAQCHTTHNVLESNSYGLFEPNSNQLCFAASAGGCHADMPTGGSSGYPAQESDRMPIGSSDPGYFEFNNGGARIPGIEHRVRWPGKNVWEDNFFSPHYADPDMPLKDYFGYGSCQNCHNPHGTTAPHDMLDTTYAGITGSESGFLPDNYALCLECHNVAGPVSMDDTALTIAYYYDRSINPGSHSGHGISTGGGYVASGTRLPCYDCHNPHGSRGYGGIGGNGYLLSDQRPGWYGLTDLRTDNDQVRRFCFGCHPPSDKTLPTDPVEGLSLQALPTTVDAHRSNATVHCYDCHGRDYSSPTANNVHNPRPSGDCVSCHSQEQGSRRAVVDEFGRTAHHAIAIGGSGSVTNNDCGVCHMEGTAATGDPNSEYHANGQIELRDPDNGLALIGFTEFTRDRNSAMLESWVVDVQNNFCLKCHDANGALAFEARVPGGTAEAPFMDPLAVTIDVDSDLDPFNPGYHPVKGPGDNQYAVPSSANNFTPTMLPPFNQTSQHDVISCFDCHVTNGHGSDTTGMLLVETYFRDPVLNPSYWMAQQEFCGRCHDPQAYVFNAENGGSRFKDHDRTAHVQSGSGSRNQLSCRGCHAGTYDLDEDAGCDNGSRTGSIHGYNFTYPTCSPTSGMSPEAFLFGGHLSGWQQLGAAQAECYANCHHRSGQDY